MNKTHKKDGELLAFRASKKMLRKAQLIAEEKMVSRSAICRQALEAFIKGYDNSNKAAV
jgi:predicted transcriptional regulator